MKLLFAACTIVAAACLAGCGAATGSPGTAVTTAPSQAGPPVWVQDEAAWQALAAGADGPVLCRWTSTSLSRAAAIAGGSASLLKTMGAHSPTRVYVVAASLASEQGTTVKASTLCLVVRPDRSTLALRVVAGRIGLRRLGPVHIFTTSPPATGVWGHTMFEGGPAPGGPMPIGGVAVGIWQGAVGSPSERPWRTVRSDRDGFFRLALAPGAYTFELLAEDHGFPAPSTVTVTAGRTVAVGVYGQAP